MHDFLAFHPEYLRIFCAGMVEQPFRFSKLRKNTSILVDWDIPDYILLYRVLSERVSAGYETVNKPLLDCCGMACRRIVCILPFPRRAIYQWRLDRVLFVHHVGIKRAGIQFPCTGRLQKNWKADAAHIKTLVRMDIGGLFAFIYF